MGVVFGDDEDELDEELALVEGERETEVGDEEDLLEVELEGGGGGFLLEEFDVVGDVGAEDHGVAGAQGGEGVGFDEVGEFG